MPKPENNGKDQYHRFFYQADACLCCSEKTWPCKITDLSLNGCLLQFESPWSEDLEKIYLLSLHMPDQVPITMALSVSHVVGNHVGFKCEHIDSESMSELRRMVKLNLGDTALLERDLLALAE